MNKPQPNSPRARLQALLAIPDRQRTDEEWDEINELEIMLAPGNREGTPDQRMQRHSLITLGHQKPIQNRNAPSKKQPKKFHKRRQRGNAP